MARAPIIISNGAVIDLLAKGIAEEVLEVEDKTPSELQKEKVKDKLKENIKTMIRDWEKTEIVILNNAGVNTPYLYWREKNDKSSYYDTLEKYKFKSPEEEGMEGEEGNTIKEIIDNVE